MFCARICWLGRFVVSLKMLMQVEQIVSIWFAWPRQTLQHSDWPCVHTSHTQLLHSRDSSAASQQPDTPLCQSVSLSGTFLVPGLLLVCTLYVTQSNLTLISFICNRHFLTEVMQWPELCSGLAARQVRGLVWDTLQTLLCVVAEQRGMAEGVCLNVRHTHTHARTHTHTQTHIHTNTHKHKHTHTQTHTYTHTHTNTHKQTHTYINFWLRVGNSGWLLWIRQWTLGFLKWWEFLEQLRNC